MTESEIVDDDAVPVLPIFDPVFKADPHALYARLRAGGGVHRVRLPSGVAGWITTRYATARALPADPRLSKRTSRETHTLFRHDDERALIGRWFTEGAREPADR